MSSPAPFQHPDPAASIAQIVGAEHCTTEVSQRRFYSTDLSFAPGKIAAIVARPSNTAELAACVAVAAAAGMAVVPRGGGMSYTQGYQPERSDTLLIDLRRMNQILEINTEDMFVRVQAGCTWKQLFEALGQVDCRTPYFGPLSGMYATIGGTLAQNSLFLGSGVYNTAAESALGLKVVLADGRVLQTGSAAHRNSNSNGFWRHFGPDLTGIFTADTGAFGIKAEVTLRLIEAPAVTLFMSFGFETLADMLTVQTILARKRICAECYGFDPYYNKSFEGQGFTFKEGLAVLADVVRQEGGIKGLWSSFKVAAAGKSFLREVPYSLHMTFDSYAKEVAHMGLQVARAVCLAQRGHEIDNTLPTVFRAHPFGGVRTLLLGAEGEVWLPIHGFMPLSKAVEVGAATEAFLADNRALMAENGIKSSYLTCFSGTEFVIEPSLYWHDELGDFRLSLIEPEFQAKWKDIPADTAKRAIALRLRQGLRDLYDQHGCCHLQLGKYYPFQEMIANEPLKDLLQGVKAVLDPEHRMNPGALGLR
ncbi:MAG: FAD-binding oxidoreductase [Gammaproteobacteria bacterium]|nr:FAD-binding oxidoreductase [Gammaproteobacteria bacterium]